MTIEVTKPEVIIANLGFLVGKTVKEARVELKDGAEVLVLTFECGSKYVVKLDHGMFIFEHWKETT